MLTRTLERITQPLLADEPPAGGGGGGGGKPEAVPYERFQSVVSEKGALAQEVSTLKAELQKLSEKAATVDTLGSELNTWKQKHAEAEGKFSTFVEFSSALGTNDTDVISVFDAKHRALPEKDRPARVEWVKSLKDKPDDAPALLKPWLAPPQAQQAPPRQAPKPVGGGGTGPAGAPKASDPAEVRAIREKAMRTGDWGPWLAYKKANGL